MTSPRILIAASAGLALLGACSATNHSSTSKQASPAASAASSVRVPDVVNASDLKTAPEPGRGAPPVPTTLVIKDLVAGSGPSASAASTVTVQYVGANYADGKVFDSSWKRGQPIDFPLSGVIPGFAQGIVGMKVGGRRELVIPPDLGYGTQGSPPAVGPDETLVFVIDLVGVR